MPRHFLELADHPASTLWSLVALAREIKKNPSAYRTLEGQTLALIFEKPSTRTRVSFEVGMRELGGEVVTLTGAEMQLGRGETLADTARVMSRYVHALMVRTNDPTKLDQMAGAATIPVINGLTDRSHPCQVMADVLTVVERKGDISSQKIVWLGDGDNNILYSWVHAAVAFGPALTIACPPQFMPKKDLLAWSRQMGGKITVTDDAAAATKDADVVITDTWVSMHQTDSPQRYETLMPYQVNRALMAHAKSDAMFMHCLPAHRGEEVTDDVMDSAQSAVWDEAENRKHAQKAVLLWCLGKTEF
ncbi:MAG: ornithine carbamoyltransferase [Alphaproteobacteria bacterium]|nr:ornithine carbamoyltransferase [Alphaproteobacteria bacterium]